MRDGCHGIPNTVLKCLMGMLLGRHGCFQEVWPLPMVTVPHILEDDIED